MSNYLDTQFRTFTIGFVNNDKKFIFQDLNGFKKALEVARLQGSKDIDINSVKELNNYGRFVKIKDMPQWLLLSMSKDVTERSQERIMEMNGM